MVFFLLLNFLGEKMNQLLGFSISEIVEATHEYCARNKPLDELYEMHLFAAALLGAAKELKCKTELALQAHYHERTENLRVSLQKKDGQFSFNDKNYKVTSKISKKIKWCQPTLKEIVTALEAGGQPVDQYVEVSYSVPENYWKMFDEETQEWIGRARHVEYGTEKISLRPLVVH